MKNLARKLHLILTIKCSEASRLESESFDRTLALHERAAVRGHQFVCWSCRKFAKQLKLMRRAFRALSDREDIDLSESGTGERLDELTKQRLKNLRLNRDS